MGSIPKWPENSRCWAEAAIAGLSIDNPALLPAARYLAASGAAQSADLGCRLSAVFAGAPPRRQAALAAFLTENGMADEALLLITPKKAAADPSAFEGRGRALAALGEWEELLARSRAAANSPESSKLFFRGWAARNLGKTSVAQKALADAFRAYVREGNTQAILSSLDLTENGKAAVPVIIEMCANGDTADSMFRLARDRFGRRGQFASPAQAYRAASSENPDAPSVQDWRQDLLAGRSVSSTETSAAAAASPADPSPRFTHALALLREGRAADALGVFHDIDIFVDRLPPAEQAIVIALWEANGLNSYAAPLRNLLDFGLLEHGEHALIMR